MTEEVQERRPRRRVGWAVGLVAAGALGGGLMMLTVPAFADPSADPSASASGSASTSTPADHRGAGDQRVDETVLTGSDAEKATAAALSAVPDATVDKVETDADGATYEAHMTKSDGTRVTVKFDANFTVTGVEDGMGAHPAR